MHEFKGVNGKKIVINCSSMKTVKKLRKALAKELLKVNIDVGNPASLKELNGTFKDTNKWLNIFKEILLGLETSEEFDEVISECLRDCTYDNIMITEDLFDNKEEARADYDRIVMEVVKENLRPFLKGVSGMLSTVGVEISNNHVSE